MVVENPSLNNDLVCVVNLMLRLKLVSTLNYALTLRNSNSEELNSFQVLSSNVIYNQF